MTAALLASACGAGGSESAPTPTTSSTATPNGPGAGRPPVVLGAKNFTEEFILGQLYTQALQGLGYRVTLVNDIGATEVVDRELTAGRIDGYPEYTGTILSSLAQDTRRPASADQAYDWAQDFEQRRGMTMLDTTPAQDSDVLAVKPAYARAHRLRSLEDLPRLGASARLGAAPEFRTRFNGLVGLRRLYGVDHVRFVPLAIGELYPALDQGRVQLAAVFTTDGQLVGGGYTLLADPKNTFGFQNVTFVVRRKVLDAEGPAFAETINAVSAKLSTQALRVLNAAVSLGQQSPAAVARQFLRANGIV
ncbi:MAG: glycine betaine ABC transporter substrate-binding protein [Solirubrobacteraceae bacterium]